MSPSFQIARLRPLATAALLAITAAPALAAAQKVYSTQQVPVSSAYSQPAYDEGDPANANLALVDRSPAPPPPLPVYVQPPAPADGYLWVPGYWSLNRYGFFWVPGAWVLAPYQGALWTPGYWGFSMGFTSGTLAIGGRTWVSTAASTTASAIRAWVMWAVTGSATASTTTGPSRT